MTILKKLRTGLGFASKSVKNGQLIRKENKMKRLQFCLEMLAQNADQLDEQSLDFPLSYAALNSCTHVPPSEAEDYSDTLQPSSIAVYADMGHLTTYCTSSHSTLQAGILDSCELVVDGSSIAG
ncbi:hypothetical protein Y032_0009g621 [Ancylostoma ceylanicum]|uniref:Uncharacterized protein n=1 Tax=Ancylostoma ceylanicum TaxID=53326 RepID=A0A016VKH6_9BILA|nr:hypothetical protein Y032_0009g621 [Ancylostoma ceylanicum]